MKLQINLMNHLLSHISTLYTKSAENCLETKVKLEAVDETYDFSYYFDEHESIVEASLPSSSREKEPQFKRRSRKGQFQCDLCPRVYKSRDGIYTHIKREHDQKLPLKCSSCNSRFKDIRSLKVHETYHLIHDGFNPHVTVTSCTICSDVFKNRQSLLRHLKRHLMPNMEKREKIYSCDYCGKKWEYKSQVKKHLFSHLLDVHRPVRQFRRSRNDITGKVICDQCSKFVMPSSMKQHIFDRHTKHPNYLCDIPGCEAGFLQKSALEKHKEHHAGIKKFVCQFCDEKFSTYGNLKQHLLRHTDPDRFTCPVCSGRFVTAYSLKKHLLTHEPDDGIRPFSCDVCAESGKTSLFKLELLLKKHIKLSHDGKLNNFVERRLIQCYFLRSNSKSLRALLLYWIYGRQFAQAYLQVSQWQEEKQICFRCTFNKMKLLFLVNE